MLGLKVLEMLELVAVFILSVALDGYKMVMGDLLRRVIYSFNFYAHL